MSQIPTLCRLVLYRLNEADVNAINRRRNDAAYNLDKIRNEKPGYQVHVGNRVQVGETYPAVVVRRNGDTPGSSINLSVLLDGTDTYWATSRGEGDENGQWSWPARS